MSRVGFILFSGLFHMLLVLAVMQLPPVFPPAPKSPDSGFAYVELAGPPEMVMGPELPPGMIDAPPGFMGPEPPPETGLPGPDEPVQDVKEEQPAPPEAEKPVVAEKPEKPAEPRPKPKPAAKPRPARRAEPVKKPAPKPEATPAVKPEGPEPEPEVMDVQYDDRRMRPFEKVEAAPVPGPSERPAVEPEKPAVRAAGPSTPAAMANISTVRPARTARQRPKPVPAVKSKPEELPKNVAAIQSGRDSVSFMYREGWPDPPMLSFDVEMPEGAGKVLWRADASEDWIIVSPGSGVGPASIRVGVMAARLGPGYRTGTLTVRPASPSYGPATIEVSIMALPESDGSAYLPHTGWDGYVNGECKVCHLPDEAMPAKDYLDTPEFCELCHTRNGIASGATPADGGHPVAVAAGSGGSLEPSPGTVPDGMYSDDMSTHLYRGKVVCVTCHNVMQKPGDLGRAWEICQPEKGGTYRAEMGGWSNMGHIEPKVYVMDKLAGSPARFGDMKKFRVDPTGYNYDPDYGTVTFRKPPSRDEFVYVTLSEPYLRVSTRNDAQCYACHDQASHMGMGCLTCHQMHGTRNLKAVRDSVYVGGGLHAEVSYTSPEGKGSLADGDGVKDGICEVCHTKTAYHTRKGGSTGDTHHAGGECSSCHSHSAGFLPPSN